MSLRCGNIALSDAWNWYVPQRLTAEMNRELETSTTPFGRVVASLHFTRKPLKSQISDLPPGILLRNRALLARGNDGKSFSLVEENYLIAGFKSLNSSNE
ncbi:hypothetical protein [Asaia prunellae]|uniref:hypothetical protein n=1 Tax=Asaia prunellae TaxID=610245 RepID=UPI0006872E43|nr:hypothetical protein [Asaia prunellae]